MFKNEFEKEIHLSSHVAQAINGNRLEERIISSLQNTWTAGVMQMRGNLYVCVCVCVCER